MTAAKTYDTKRKSIVTPTGIKCQEDEHEPEVIRSTLTPQSPTARFLRKSYSITQTWLHMNKSSRSDADFDCLFPENNSSNLKKIKFVTYPYHLWGLGTILLGGASFFCYALSSTSIYRFPKGFWWQYVFAVLLYILGALCFIFSTVEVFCMDRNKGVISICNLSCMNYIFGRGKDTVVVRELAEIENVSVDCMGEKVGDVDTRMYKIRIEYKDGTFATMLEDRSKSLAVRRCRSLKYFLAFYANSPSKKATRSPTKLSPVKKVPESQPQAEEIQSITM
ncbi:transmembrane protein [Thraustotheca clavata]|uniref:Transmembrane protein n=1 Tax=Thraustotheca clavata TaxID=74557 RepID=A0A1V9YUI5_9STRA|nr:transmembrane protein [Thraustotheca clavata]